MMNGQILKSWIKELEADLQHTACLKEVMSEMHYLRGLTLEWKGQGNPYKFGVIGSSDTHTGAGGFDENNYWSKAGVLDGTDMGRGSVPLTQDRIEQLEEYAEAL